MTLPSSNIGDISGHWTLWCTCSTPIIQVNISEICIINKTRIILCLTMYLIFISFCFCFVILASFSLFRTEGFENPPKGFENLQLWRKTEGTYYRWNIYYGKPEGFISNEFHQFYDYKNPTEIKQNKNRKEQKEIYRDP